MSSFNINIGLISLVNHFRKARQAEINRGLAGRIALKDDNQNCPAQKNQAFWFCQNSFQGHAKEDHQNDCQEEKDC